MKWLRGTRGSHAWKWTFPKLALQTCKNCKETLLYKKAGGKEVSRVKKKKKKNEVVAISSTGEGRNFMPIWRSPEGPFFFSFFIFHTQSLTHRTRWSSTASILTFIQLRSPTITQVHYITHILDHYVQWLLRKMLHTHVMVTVNPRIIDFLKYSLVYHTYGRQLANSQGRLIHLKKFKSGFSVKIRTNDFVNVLLL